jgi:hypothetical protein
MLKFVLWWWQGGTCRSEIQDGHLAITTGQNCQSEIQDGHHHRTKLLI